MKPGFTMIELLIVVAIIALLAAIAVPNFMEAQTRSKVSRVKNDLRTYSVAISSYTVDNARPPLGFNEFGMQNGGGMWVGLRYRIYHFLTTPVAYMATLPTDPFATPIPKDEDGNEMPESVYYYFNTFIAGKSNFGGDELNSALNKKGFTWAMYSIGPNRLENKPIKPWCEEMLCAGSTPAMAGNVYDPTNGTVSRGKIYRTNKGELTIPW